MPQCPSGSRPILHARRPRLFRHTLDRPQSPRDQSTLTLVSTNERGLTSFLKKQERISAVKGSDLGVTIEKFQQRRETRKPVAFQNTIDRQSRRRPVCSHCGKNQRNFPRNFPKSRRRGSRGRLRVAKPLVAKDGRGPYKRPSSLEKWVVRPLFRGRTRKGPTHSRLLIPDRIRRICGVHQSFLLRKAATQRHVRI